MRTALYQHTQPGTLMRVILGTMAACTVVAAVTFLALHKAPVAVPCGVAAVVLLASLAVFHSLSVTVTDDAVEIRFGPGWIRKRFATDSIVACRPVRNSLGHGWGIHWCGKAGWVYNVSGFDAVELEFKDGKKARIGTDEPQRLAEAIGERIQSKGAAGR